MACSNPQNPDCQNCNKSGLAILPVRYAVVPAAVDAALPPPMGNKVSDVPLTHHKYALRTLRQGYLYLFYEKHPKGKQIKWEVYSSTNNGTLWNQISISSIHALSIEPACSRTGHNIPASVITIENPEKSGKVWMAFSEHIWSAETFKQFESDSALRDRRMQTFLPATWITAGGYRHGLPATKANLDHVIEYKSDFKATALTGGIVTEISTPDGKHKADRLKAQGTRYQLHMRDGEKQSLLNTMKDISTKKDGSKVTPIIIALWDAVGIAHELNGFRNDAAGWMKKYGDERELEITALNAIEGVKTALEKKAVDNETQRQQETRANAPKMSSTLERRARAASMSAEQRKNELEVCDIIDGWAARDLPVTSGFAGRLNAANTYPEPRRSAQIAEIKAQAETSLANRERNSPAMIQQAHDMAWPKYEAKLTPGAYQAFKTNYDAFLSEAGALVDARTTDLISWLKSKYLINQLTEFHASNVDDGVVFDDQVGKMIHGINSSPSGQAIITTWIEEMRASENNLIWRTLALNQSEGIAAVDKLLAETGSKSAPVGKLALDFVATHVRKMADIYKKANTMQNTLIKSENAAEGIKKIKVTGFDRLFMTVGDRLFLPFIQRGVDTAAEFGVRGLMMARAGVEPSRILDAVQTQAKLEGLARAAVVNRIKTAKTFLGVGGDLKEAKFAELGKSWEKLKADPVKGATALKENRLSLLVATLEIVNLLKISWEFKDNERTYGELGAAICTTAAAVSDIAANAAKHLVGDKVSRTFQYLKAYGGILSAGAGYYTALKDWDKSINHLNKQKYGLFLAYNIKSLSQFLAATFGLLSSLSYAAPLLQASGSKLAQMAGQRLLLYRLFFMTWAVRLNMIGLAITALVWIFTPNPLKEWCEESPFGPKKKSGPKTPDKLLEELGAALQEIS